MTLQCEAVRPRLLLDAGIQLEVSKFRELAAPAADEVMVVAALAQLVADAAVLERNPAEEVQLMEELNRPENGGPPHLWKRLEKLLDRKWSTGGFDGTKDGSSRRRPPEPDGLEARVRQLGKAHVTILANRGRRAPRVAPCADTPGGRWSVMAYQVLPEQPVQCVIFAAGGCRHALPIDAVREILVPGPLTPAPGAPPGVLGLTQVRGHALPVVDLAARLGFGATALTPDRRLVVVSAGNETAALLVDSVDEVAIIPAGDFELVRLPGGREHLVLKRHGDLVGWVEPGDVVGAGYERGALAA